MSTAAAVDTLEALVSMLPFCDSILSVGYILARLTYVFTLVVMDDYDWLMPVNAFDHLVELLSYHNNTII